jgi:hypothetical protein
VINAGRTSSDSVTFEVIHQSPRGNAKDKRRASLILYYRDSANAARSIYRVCRGGATAQIGPSERNQSHFARPGKEPSSIFVKVICWIQIERYTRRKEYDFNQSSA